MEGEADTAPAAAAAAVETAPAAAAPRQPRRGPAPIASFDHDGSDEVRPDSSPESKQAFRLPEIVEHPAGCGEWLSAPGGGRARSHSTPAAGALPTPAPRIDISRASSSSHHDSRDSSPELALFAGDASDGKSQRLELGFREDGALDLRSSTEELSFLEPAPGETRAPPPADPGPTAPAPPAVQAPPPAPPPDRRHSRKDSQSSEAALLGVSGRTSRLSSVGSACSAVSRVSRLSVVSGVSRSPSPHRMLLETSFCGPKPIETDPEACAAAVAEHILEIAKLTGESAAAAKSTSPPTPPPNPRPQSVPAPATTPAVDARDHREVRTEVTVEAARSATGPAVIPASAVPRSTRQPALALSPVMATASKVPQPEKTEKETKNRARTEERKARPRVRREPSEPEVYKSRNKSKDIIRIKLRPDDEEEEEDGEGEAARKPASLALGAPAAPASAPAPASPAPSRRRSPSPLGPPSVSRKSSFCSLFKSRETIGSPDSPQAQEALRRKRSLTEGRARSKSRDRSATPTSSKIRGSVLSLFRTPRKSATASSPGSRATSPTPTTAAAHPSAPADPRRAQQDKLKYYEDAKNGIIHIPLRTPPEERGAASSTVRRSSGAEAGPSGVAATTTAAAAEAPHPISAPQVRDKVTSSATSTAAGRAPPVLRTVLPDGSIIIPLHSPTERLTETIFPETTRPKDPSPPEPRPITRRGDIETAPNQLDSVATSISSPEATATPLLPEPRPKEPEPMPSPPEQPPPEVTNKRRKERLVFTTHVGSREQVFSTQFSITKTPSVTSEISGSFPSFDNGELRDTHITADPPAPAAVAAATPAASVSGSLAGSLAVISGSGAVSPQDPPRDSSESEPSSEAAAPQAGNDVERRGLVVQESFEEELPYVPTTLPQERSVAVPMVPVRDRGGVLVRSVQRPRAAPPSFTPAAPSAPVGVTSTVASARAPPVCARATPPPAQATTPPGSADKLRIKLPRRPRVSSASSAPRPSRERTRSGGGDSGGENRTKQEWIDFEEVPERRKQPKRIQTLPVGAADDAEAGVVFSYVEPEHCRCECHAHAQAEDQLPLLDDMQQSRISSSSAECGEEEGGTRRPPFTTDLDLRNDAHALTEPKEHP